MKTETIQNAVYGIEESFLSEFDRETANKKQKRSFAKITVPAACFAVLAAAGFGVYNSGFFRPEPGVPTDGQTDAAAPFTVLATEPVSSAADSTAEWKEETETAPAIPETTAEQEPHKGGDTSDLLRNYEISPYDGAYYRVFHPATDVFSPKDDMTLENRFCSVSFNGRSYYPAPDGDITAEDYEPDLLDVTRATHYEIIGADEDIKGIIYAARVEIHKLRNTVPEEAIACVIKFLGETKEYRYLVSPEFPVWTP